MMNKKGQTIGIAIGIMVAIIIFMVGLMAVNFLKDEVTRARNSDNLNCAAPTTDGTKLSCLAVDAIIPYFIIIVLSASGGAITARLLV